MNKEQALYQLKILEQKVEDWKKWIREEFPDED